MDSSREIVVYRWKDDAIKIVKKVDDNGNHYTVSWIDGVMNDSRHQRYNPITGERIWMPEVRQHTRHPKHYRRGELFVLGIPPWGDKMIVVTYLRTGNSEVLPKSCLQHAEEACRIEDKKRNPCDCTSCGGW